MPFPSVSTSDYTQASGLVEKAKVEGCTNQRTPMGFEHWNNTTRNPRFRKVFLLAGEEQILTHMPVIPPRPGPQGSKSSLQPADTICK